MRRIVHQLHSNSRTPHITSLFWSHGSISNNIQHKLSYTACSHILFWTHPVINLLSLIQHLLWIWRSIATIIISLKPFLFAYLKNIKIPKMLKVASNMSTSCPPITPYCEETPENENVHHRFEPACKSEGDKVCFWCGKSAKIVCTQCNDTASYCSQDHLEQFHLHQDTTNNKILQHCSNEPAKSNSNNNCQDSNEKQSFANTGQNIEPRLNGNHKMSSSSISSQQQQSHNKKLCLPYKICSTKEKGRVVVATREIQPLELIMADTPFIIGPSRQQQIVCVECLTPVDGRIRCKDCNYPICRPECIVTTTETTPPKWHISLECPYLKSINYRATDSLTDRIKTKSSSKLLTDIPFILVELASIAPLRLLLKGIKEEKCTRERFVNQPIYDFCSPAQNTPRICAFESDMCSVIWDGMKMKDTIKEMDTVRKIICQLFNNAKSLEKQGHNGSGLYGRYAMINHSCVSNSKVVVGKSSSNYTIQVRAQVMIKKGEEITTRYVGITNGVPLRAEMLLEHWCFTCSCVRCVDPTELGSYSSAILCKKCLAFKEGNAQGLLLPNPSSSSLSSLGTSPPATTTASGMIAASVAAAATEWMCNTCGHSSSKSQIEKIIEEGLRCIK